MKNHSHASTAKRLLALFLSILALSPLTSCGGKQNPEEADNTAAGSTPQESTRGDDSAVETKDTEADIPNASASLIQESFPEEPCDETVTVMIYMIGSNLESKASAGTNDLEEIKASGADLKRNNILVYTGGSKKWFNGLPVDKNPIIKLTENGFETVKEFGIMSMGDPESLTRFLRYGYETYPADSYELILWDHGNGPIIGYGKDMLYKNDTLTLPEMKKALDDSPFGKDNKLAFIGFDACLMSSAELICTMSDYADYLIASQETEPSGGWDYSFLKKCGKITPKSLAGHIADKYIEYYEEYYKNADVEGEDLTLSVMNLACAGELEKAIDALFAEAGADIPESYSDLARSRVDTKAIGRASTGSDYDLVDLEGLAENMEDAYPEKISSLCEVLEKTVVHARSTADGYNGISLYYPFYNKTYYEKSWKDEYAEIDVLPEYRSYLDKYCAKWLSLDVDAEFSLISAPVAVSDETYELTMTEEQASMLADSGYYIFRKDGVDLYTPIFYSNMTEIDGNIVRAKFDGNIIYLNTVYDKKIIPLKCTDSGKESIEYSSASIVKASYEKPMSSQALSGENKYLELELNLRLDKKTGKLTMKGIYEKEEEESVGGRGDGMTNGKRTEFDSDGWKYLIFGNLQASYLTRDENGAIRDYSEWPDNGWYTLFHTRIGNGIDFSYEPFYDDGDEYCIMIRLTDTYGNVTMSEPLPINLKEAPEETKKESVKKINWDGGSSVALPETNGLSLSLHAVNDLKFGEKLLLKAENKSDHSLSAEIWNVFCDGYCSGTGSGSSINNFAKYTFNDIEPGKSSELELDTVYDICMINGTSFPSELSFSLYLTDEDLNRTVVLGDTYSVTMKNIEPSSVLPLREMKAENSVLYDKDGIRITLLAAGAMLHDSSRDLSFVFKTENNSDRSKTVSVSDIFINGIYADNVLFSEETSPGTERYTCKTMKSEILECFGIEDISSLAVSVSASGKTERTEVVLDKHGSSPAIEPNGKPLFEDDSIAIYGYGTCPEFGTTSSKKTDKHARIIIKNKTDETVYWELGGAVSKGEEAAGEYSDIWGFLYRTSGFFGSEKLIPPKSSTVDEMLIKGISDYKGISAKLSYSLASNQDKTVVAEFTLK